MAKSWAGYRAVATTSMRFRSGRVDSIFSKKTGDPRVLKHTVFYCATHACLFVLGAQQYWSFGDLESAVLELFPSCLNLSETIRNRANPLELRVNDTKTRNFCTARCE